jgi:hypothetical protein
LRWTCLEPVRRALEMIARTVRVLLAASSQVL